jgi:IS5 family transposase
VLANKIDWNRFDKSYGNLFGQKKDRLALPTRLLVGLHYLKHAYNEKKGQLLKSCPFYVYKI